MMDCMRFFFREDSFCRYIIVVLNMLEPLPGHVPPVLDPAHQRKKKRVCFFRLGYLSVTFDDIKPFFFFSFSLLQGCLICLVLALGWACAAYVRYQDFSLEASDWLHLGVAFLLFAYSWPFRPSSSYSGIERSSG